MFNFKYNSLHRKFYTSTWNEDVPNDLCTYFRGLVLAMLFWTLFPPVLILCLLLFPLAFYEINMAGEITWYGIFMIAFSFYGHIALAIAIVFLVSMLFKTDVAVMTTSYVKAKKESICPRINWDR